MEFRACLFSAGCDKNAEVITYLGNLRLTFGLSEVRFWTKLWSPRRKREDQDAHDDLHMYVNILRWDLHSYMEASVGDYLTIDHPAKVNLEPRSIDNARYMSIQFLVHVPECSTQWTMRQ